MDGYVVDVVGRDDLVEIQTASFASARRKLERLVASHRVVLVTRSRSRSGSSASTPMG